LWQKFLEIISRILPLRPLAVNEEALAQLDPEKIYIENVRSLLNVSFQEAEAICEAATRQGLFKKGIEVICPNGAVAAAVEFGKLLPKYVECWVEEDGQLEPREMETNALQKITYYRFNRAGQVAHA
jgi:hypothetical protein